MVTLLSGLNRVNAAVVKATGESSDPQGVVKSKEVCQEERERHWKTEDKSIYRERKGWEEPGQVEKREEQEGEREGAAAKAA